MVKHPPLGTKVDEGGDGCRRGKKGTVSHVVLRHEWGEKAKAVSKLSLPHTMTLGGGLV